MKPMQHPLESVFGMEEGTLGSDIENDYAIAEQAPQGQLTEAPLDVKDEDDKLIEQRLDDVYEVAIQTFHNQTAYLEVIEPRYAARNAEVAANYLNIALAAANSRAKVKSDRKRANQAFVPYANGGKTTNNLVIADRNDILKMINIDGITKEVK
jgi:hypothetical protein